MTDTVIDAPANSASPTPGTDTQTAAPTNSAPAQQQNTAVPADANADPAVMTGDPEPTDPQSWPDDWRDRFAGSDDKLKARLARFSSPENIFKSFLEAEKKIKSGQAAAPRSELPENPTAEELAVWRRDNGIPETPAGYEFKAPEGLELNDADKEEISYFQSQFHEMNLPPQLAGKLFDAYFYRRGEVENQIREDARDKTVNARAQLRAEYGKEFERNINVGKTWLDSAIGSDARNELSDTILADGTRLGDSPAFVRLIVQAGLQNAGDDTLAEAEFGGGGKSLAEQYREALALKFEDPKAYNTPGHQAKLVKLAAAKAKAQG